MKANRIIPAKFLAVFSNQAKIRRHSLSQPMRRSTMLRFRYASRSNSTGRLLRSSFSRDGMTGLIPRSSRYSSIQSARYPLSPASATGHATGSPLWSASSSSAPSSSWSRTVDSWVWPGVKQKCKGWPTPSQSRWILVDNPPRERPNAWSSGSSGSLFCLRQTHTLQHEQRCHQYTRVLNRTRPLRQTPPATLQEFGPADRCDSIHRTAAKRFCNYRTPQANHATELPYSNPKDPIDDCAAINRLSPSPFTSWKDQRSTPIDPPIVHDVPPLALRKMRQTLHLSKIPNLKLKMF